MDLSVFRHGGQLVFDEVSSWSASMQALTLGALLIIVPVGTRIASTLSFKKSVEGTRDDNVVPVVPYWLPGFYHLIPFLRDSAGFTLNIVKRYGWETPLRLKALNLSFTITANPEHIITIFKQTRYLSARSITARSARYLLDVPARFMQFYQADDSGMAAQPRKGSLTTQENRILYHQTRTSQKFLASPYLEPLAQRFAEMLHRNLEELNIDKDWVELEDLFKFLQVTVSKANIEAIMGSKIIEMHPNLVQDFWAAKSHAPEYFQGWPRWLIPEAFRRRDRVLDSIQKWHSYAFVHGDYTTTGPDDPDWEPTFGSRYVKMRLQYMLKMFALDDRVRACEDWGLMFGSNANTLPTVFWYLVEALRDPKLSARMQEEATACVSDDGSVKITDLAKKPLMQSVYAETLRLRVSILVSRMVEFGQVDFASYTLPIGEYVLIPTDAMHYNTEAWERAGRKSKIPLELFDAERFLVLSEEHSGTLDFSLDGLAGLWIPFGGGDRMCPGRHLTKLEMMITYAYLFTRYDLELVGEDGGKVESDMRFAPFGALPPDRAVRFRIRRKAIA